MTFLEGIFDRLDRNPAGLVLREIHEGRIVPASGSELLSKVQQARDFLVARGLKKGDRCALLAPNGIRWVALDLAMMAEGIIVVPLYARQSPAELVAMMKDCSPARICCSDAGMAAEIQKLWPAAPKVSLLDGIFAGESSPPRPPIHHADSDALTIIYTSGTSGEPKGVLLNAGNVNYMLGCTNARLDQLMGARTVPDQIFQYGPFSLAASWILLLTALTRSSVLSLSTNISKLSDELKTAAPNYFLNVPLVLERVRAKVEEMVRQRGGFAASVFSRAQLAYSRRQAKEASFLDSLWLALANTLIFPAIRKSLGPNLKGLICGSAPLAVETQLFYMMIGIPVLQAYGLTETTAICTLDDPHHVEPGRVGPAIPGMEMTVAENGEILARGPNIFPGYWQRPEETAKALEGGWFHTGDLGEVDSSGNWRITGRVKNILILNSGHKVAPEPLEDALARQLPEAGHVVLLGNQRSFLAALVTPNGGNGLTPERIQQAMDSLNAGLPHYKQIRAFQLLPEPFTLESGLLTSNGKLKRDAIAGRFAAEIERLFEKKTA
ncbi:MAG TPA: AMP-binding protein [Candidatus Sulfotelmatobacter sp.]|nr:AMP-binding protein [Candidatus Sulfotelmatobacter sp.]